MKFLVLLVAGWAVGVAALQGPCSGVRCQPGEHCELVYPPCHPGAPVCNPVPVCRRVHNPCEGVRCPPGQFCREQPGTNLPQCFDPCHEARCRHDQTCQIQNVVCIRAPCPPIGVCVDHRPTPVTNPCQYVRCGHHQECRLRVCRPYSGETCPFTPVCRPISDDSPCPVGQPILSTTDSEIQCGHGHFASSCPRGTRCTPDYGSFSSVCCLDSPFTPPTLPPPTKPGVCAPPTRPGVCAEFCSGDYSCPGPQKCCSNGCGHSCQPPGHGVTVFGK